jgi:glycosyltransferase involved in cell wall biosynthesis
MRVLLHIYYPFFHGHLAGGAQTTVRLYTQCLVERGFTVRVLCPKSVLDEMMPMTEEAGIAIWPLLTEVTATEPSPSNQAANLRAIVSAVRDVDVVWTVDRRFPLVTRQPIILTYSTLGIYPDEFVTLFDTNWDLLLVPSEYCERRIVSWLPTLDALHKPPAIKVVSPVLDPLLLTSGEPAVLRRWLGHTRDDLRYVAFPHRPEPDKGHEEALRILAELVRIDSRYHLLIPEPPLSRHFDVGTERNYITDLRLRASSSGLEKHVTFHRWVPRELRHHYYAGTECCLFLSKLPETFGLSLIEAIACGAFVVSRGSGALGETVPAGMGHLILPEAPPCTIARVIAKGLPIAEVNRGRAFVRERYSAETVGEQLAEVFTTVSKSHWLYSGE